MKDREVNGEARVLCWPGQLLSEDDLRRHLTCQSEILLATKTVVTPLAMDHLRGKGVRIRREDNASSSAVRAANLSERGAWGFARQIDDALATAVIAALQRDGIALSALPGTTPRQWATAIAEAVVAGGIVFCGDAGLVCCVANKVAGVRAVQAINIVQAKRAKEALGANLFALESASRTFHELRQIARIAVGPTTCPPNVAKVLQELDGHAHR